MNLLANLISRLIVEEINFEEFKQSINKAEYASKNGKYLGQGSSRFVFDLENGNVLKIADGNSGLVQNKQEITICNKFCKSGLFAKIFDFDPNYEWLVMEKVKTWSEDEFTKIIGFGDQQLGAFLIQAEKNEPTKEGFEATIKTSMRWHWFSEAYKKTTPEGLKLLNVVFTLASKYGINDIDRYDHFGTTNSGKIVVLDYGLKL